MKNKEQNAPRELDINEIAAVSGGTETPPTEEMANETYVNRVKTSDKQQKAVLDFIKS